MPGYNKYTLFQKETCEKKTARTEQKGRKGGKSEDLRKRKHADLKSKNAETIGGKGYLIPKLVLYTRLLEAARKAAFFKAKKYKKTRKDTAT
jgi:hypothetical protein